MSTNINRSEWKRVAFGEVIRHVTDRVDAMSSGLERFLAGEHIPSRRLDIQDWGVIGRDPVGPMFYKRFQPGHVLYVSRRAYLRKVAVPRFEGITGEKTFVLETLDETRLLQDFLPFLLSAEPFHQYAVANSRGSVNPYVNWTDLAAFEFDLPPVDEQRRIAGLLRAVEDEVSARAETLARLEVVVDCWMSAALEDGHATYTLGELVDHSVGGVWGVDEGRADVDVRVIRGTDISVTGEIKWVQAPARSIKTSEARARTLAAGDVLIEKSGGSPDQPVGKVGLVAGAPPHSAVPSNFVLLARANRALCEPEFLFVLLRGMWRSGRFAEFTGKTTNIANLRTKELLAAVVKVPDLSRQRDLLDRLDRLDAARRAAQVTADSARSLKVTLLAEIFGGIGVAV